MAPQRILRLTGSYSKLDGVSEADFHHFISTDHAVKSAKIHERYGILKYQLVSVIRIPCYRFCRSKADYGFRPSIQLARVLWPIV
jgi:hypothetical protein